MQTKHSQSLLLAWQLAELEARRLQAAFLEPAHLLLGLCKAVDIDATALVPAGTTNRDAILEELLREFRRIREVFHRAAFDPTRFRRHYRTALPEGSAGLNPPSARLHRSGAAKDVFADAEQTAQVSGAVVYPLHLLYSLLSENDPLRDKAMTDTGTDVKRLRGAIRQAVIPQSAPAAVSTGPQDTKWN